MKHPLPRETIIKLLVPVLYGALAIVYFIYSWPSDVRWYHIAGVLLALPSFVCWIVAIVQKDKALSQVPKSKFLVTHGLYRKLRHPVSYFSTAALSGVFLYIFEPLGLVMVPYITVTEIFQIRQEEALLTKDFGKEYLEYKKTTWF